MLCISVHAEPMANAIEAIRSEQAVYFRLLRNLRETNCTLKVN